MSPILTDDEVGIGPLEKALLATIAWPLFVTLLAIRKAFIVVMYVVDDIYSRIMRVNFAKIKIQLLTSFIAKSPYYGG